MSGYRIRNWDTYQHYKDRNPAWVKLHWSILTSRDWVSLDDASRVLAVASMLLASRNEDERGVVPNDPAYIQRVAFLNSPPNFAPLVKCGFLIPDGISESREEEEKEDRGRERVRAASVPLADASTSHKATKKPYGELRKVLLTDEEHAKLSDAYGDRMAAAIEILDTYLASKGKRYASHYAVMKRNGWVWEKTGGGANPKQPQPVQTTAEREAARIAALHAVPKPERDKLRKELEATVHKYLGTMDADDESWCRVTDARADMKELDAADANEKG